MASGSADKVQAGEAFVRATVVDETKEPLAAITRDMKAWGQSLSDIGKGVMAGGLAISGAGLALLTPLLAAAGRTEALGSALADMSARTGATIESLGALKYAAEQSDVSFDALGMAITKLQKLLADPAASKSGLTDLGLDPAALMAMKPEEQFAAIADKIAGIQDPAVRAAAAMEIFGKSGRDLLPLLNGGAQGIEELMARAVELGIVMDTETATAAEAWGDAWATLTTQTDHLIASIGSALIPYMNALAEVIQDNLGAIIAFVRENGAAVAAVAATGIGLQALGATVITVGASITAMGVALGVLTSPVTLVVAGVVALGAALVTAFGGWDELAGVMRAVFLPVAQEVIEVGGEIKDALSVGGIAGAWELLGLNLKFFVESLVSAWGQGMTQIAHWIDELVQKVTLGLLDLENLMGKGWLPDSLGAETVLERSQAWSAGWAMAAAETARQMELIKQANQAELAAREAAAQPKEPDLVVYLDEPLEPFMPRQKGGGKAGFFDAELDKTDWGEVAKTIDESFSAIGTTSAEVASRIGGFTVDWSRKTADNTGRMVETLDLINDHLDRWGPAVFA